MKFREESGQNSIALGLGLTVGVFAVVFLIWLLFAGTVMVNTGEIGVLTRFGRVTGKQLGEGFHFKNPFDHANKYDVKVQKDDAKAAAASKDLQDVHSTLVLNFRLEAEAVPDLHQKVGTDYKEKLIHPAIQEVFKASTAHFDATSLITDRPAVKSRALSLLTERLEKYGIKVIDLSITNFSFSQEFTAAIESKQVAQQNAERAKFNLEASKTDALAQKAQAASLSEFYLRKLFLEKWDGHLPNVMSGDMGGFLVNIGDATK